MYMDIACHRCGEIITAPYFHEGKPYGYSCIKIVNPSVKKKQVKEHWVKADTHNYNPSGGKHLVIAISGSVKRKSYVVTNIDTGKLYALDARYMQVSGPDVFINLL
jgi:hypothetical protein